MGAVQVKYVDERLLSKDLTGKTIVITGANSGIGESTALQLSKQGANVIVGCRRMTSGQKVADACNAQSGGGKSVAMEVDLASLDSVRTFVDTFTKSFDMCDILVNNAGIMNCPKGETKDGFELQFGTNHLGHFLLTHMMIPSLKKSVSPKVICLSSVFHDEAMGKKGVIAYDDLMFETRKYDGWSAYAQSKLANLLFAREMAKQYPEITTVSVHPGFVKSNLMKVPAVVKPVLNLMMPVLMGMIQPWEGVQTSLHAILEDNLENGAYYAQQNSPKGCVGGWPTVSPNYQVTDENAAKLWLISENLVGLN